MTEVRDAGGMDARALGVSAPRRMSEVLSKALPGATCRSPIATPFLLSTAVRSVEEGVAPFTKRRSAASYAIPEPRLVVAMPGDDPPAAIVRATRTGGAALSVSVGKLSREVFLKPFHLSLPEASTRSNTPRCETGKTPSRMLTGVFPLSSKGCDGTRPTEEPDRTHVAVTGLHPPFPLRA